MKVQVESVGPYKLESLLGQGGMGEVYRAYDQRLERYVAIKHIRKDRAPGPKARQRFRREAKAAAALAHPGIVQVFDILEFDSDDWIVMELVEGQTLSSLLLDGPLDPSKVIDLTRSIASALAYAHDRGFVHRDLKTENVMISDLGSPKILDFGLAKNLAKPESSLTIDGALVGTVRAMSPEQALGQAVDTRSDLFSLGILIYECLTGQPPFRGESAASILHQICTHQQEPLRLLNSDVSGELSGLVDRLLAKDPSARPTLDAVIAVGESPSSGSTGDFSEDLFAETLYDSSSSDACSEAALPDGVPRDPSPTPAGSLVESEGEHTELEVADAPRGTASKPDAQSIRWRARGLAGLLLAFLVLALGFLFRPWNIWNSETPSAAGRPLLPNHTLGDGHATFLRGMELLDSLGRPGDLDRAVNLFADLVEQEPNSPSAHAGLAKATWIKYRKTGEKTWIDQALASAYRAVEKGEYLALAHASLGNVLLELGQAEESLSSFETAMRLEPSSVEGHLGVARYHEDQGELELAEEAYRRAVEIQPDNRLVLDRLGSLLFKDARLDEAEGFFRRSIDAAPGRVAGYANLAGVYFLRDDFDAAASVLQEGLLIRPHSYLYTNLGTLLFYRGEYEASIEPFSKAVQLDAGARDHVMWANLGDAFRWTPGHADEMRDAYHRAIELVRNEAKLKPADVRLRSRLALYLARRGDWTTALQEAARVEELEELSASVIYEFALVYEQCGKRRQALEKLRMALEKGYPLSAVTNEQELDRLRADPAFATLERGFD